MVLFVAWAGLDNTLKLFKFTDLRIRFILIRFRFLPLKWDMEKRFSLPHNKWQDIKDILAEKHLDKLQ